MCLMKGIMRMAPGEEHEKYGGWCYHVRGLMDLLDIREEVAQMQEYRSMAVSFDPAAEWFEEEVILPKIAPPEKAAVK